MSESLLMLHAAAAAVLLLHLVVAGTRVRDALTGMMGEGPYLGLFSIASLGVFVWLAIAYNAASAEGPEVYWSLGPAVTHSGLIVVAIAFIMGLPGVLMPSPTSVGQEGTLAQAEPETGVLRITRHPFLWSVALWAAFHLAANGDAASVVFFGTFLLLSVLGTYSIDAKRARKQGAAWSAYARRTSNIPFAAILSGRQRLVVSELLTWRQGVALLIFLAVLFAHARLFGVSPFPGGWVPF